MNIVKELVPFSNVCDEFIAGKYIFADTKIDAIFNIIEENERLKNIINSTIINYDFNVRFKESIVETESSLSIVLPTIDEEIVSFVYSLLFNIKNNNIDFNQFLATYYNKEEDIANKEFTNFANHVLIPFKNAIISIYNKRYISNQSEKSEDTTYFEKLMTTTRLIAENIDSYKLKINEKEEFTMMLNSLYLASEKNDKKFVYSLMIGLDYFTKCNKKARVAYLSLEECFE